MKIINRVINCKEFDEKSNRVSPFTVCEYSFSYENEEDKIIIDEFIAKGLILAKRVNPNAANNSYQSRNLARIQNNCIAGLLAEFAWRHYLNQNQEVVAETIMEDVSKQIDLKIISNNKTIEVRSSFPRNGVDFAICHSRYQFDVIGPYSNGYKPSEIQKDYYVRVLYPFESKDLLLKIKSTDFKFYLTGGADWQRMIDNSIAIEKDFIPEDEIDINKFSQKTSYRVIPFSKALDTETIADLIRKE